MKDGTGTNTTGDSTTQNSLTNATLELAKSPKSGSHHVIDVEFTPQQFNCLSVLAVLTATRSMLQSISSGSDPYLTMSECYLMKVENDSIPQKLDFQLKQEKLKLEQSNFCKGGKKRLA